MAEKTVTLVGDAETDICGTHGGTMCYTGTKQTLVDIQGTKVAITTCDIGAGSHTSVQGTGSTLVDIQGIKIVRVGDIGAGHTHFTGGTDHPHPTPTAGSSQTLVTSE